MFGVSYEEDKKNKQESASNEENPQHSNRIYQENKQQQSSDVSSQQENDYFKHEQESLDEREDRGETASDSVFKMRFHIFIPPDITVNKDFKVGIYSNWCGWKHHKMTSFPQIE